MTCVFLTGFMRFTLLYSHLLTLSFEMFSVVASPIITSLLLDSLIVFHYLIYLLQCMPLSLSLSLSPSLPLSLGKNKPSLSVQGCTCRFNTTASHEPQFFLLNIHSCIKTLTYVQTRNMNHNCVILSPPLHPVAHKRLSCPPSRSHADESSRMEE